MDLHGLPTDRPLLLIDVDGVLNPTNHSRNEKRYALHRVQADDGLFYQVRLLKTLPSTLSMLSRLYTLMWATMWDDDANRLLAPLLDLPELPVIPCRNGGLRPRRPGSRLHHKIEMIEAYVGDRSFAFIDDEVTRHDEEWAELRSNTLAPTKVLRIDCRMGLLDHHVNKLVAWAETLS